MIYIKIEEINKEYRAKKKTQYNKVSKNYPIII